MENEKRLSFLASEVAIAEDEKLNPVFLSIKMKLADNAGNRNNEGITAEFISDLIKRHFKVAHTDGLGLHDMPCAATAAGALLTYLYETQMNDLGNISRVAKGEDLGSTVHP